MKKRQHGITITMSKAARRELEKRAFEADVRSLGEFIRRAVNRALIHDGQQPIDWGTGTWGSRDREH